MGTIEQPTSAIYFHKHSGAMAKSLGARIRDQGAMVRLVWSHLFKGPDQMIENVKAVVIEDGCPGAAMIAKCYARFASDCEIHFVDSEGKFIDEPDYIKGELGGDSALPGKTFVDPKAALASLKAAGPAEPEAVPEQLESEDFGEPAAEEFSEAGAAEPQDDTPAGDTAEDADSEYDSGVHSEEAPLEDDSDR